MAVSWLCLNDDEIAGYRQGCAQRANRQLAAFITALLQRTLYKCVITKNRAEMTPRIPCSNK
jgi:hypothetical protein